MASIRFTDSIKRFLRDQSGPTAVEYCVIILLILLVVLTAIQVLAGVTGDSLGDSSQQIDRAIQN